MSRLPRTPDMPTKPGLYWLFQDGHDPQIVEVVFDGESRIVYMAGSEDSFDIDDISVFDESECEWAGPLDPPA